MVELVFVAAVIEDVVTEASPTVVSILVAAGESVALSVEKPDSTVVIAPPAEVERVALSSTDNFSLEIRLELVDVDI